MTDPILKGKIALITGAGSGIGHAAAILFSREGAQLLLADIDAQNLEKTVRCVEKNGGKAVSFCGDLSSAAIVKEMLEKTVAYFGRLDCAFNNAGSEGDVAATADCEEMNWDRMMAVNLKSVWLCMKFEIPLMMKQKAGSIVNTGSVAGVVAERGFPAYAAAKGGVIQLTRSAAVEYAHTGVRINAVCPGLIDTPMANRAARSLRISAMMPGIIRSQGMQKLADGLIRLGPIRKTSMRMMQPMGRPGKPEEVAEAALWLCSDRSSFVTGQAILVDGGLTAQ